jgi:hypothetical protein
LYDRIFTGTTPLLSSSIAWSDRLERRRDAVKIRRSILTAGMAVVLTTPAMANAVEVTGVGPTGAARHANTVASKRSGKTGTRVGSFANIPGFNIAVQSSLGFSSPR